MDSQSELIEYAKLTGRGYDQAVPFIYASARSYITELKPIRTPAISYWHRRSDESSILITHFRWTIDNEEYEVCKSHLRTIRLDADDPDVQIGGR